MNCLACKDLYRAFQRTHTGYMDAYSSAFFKVSTEIAAMKHVAMERARNDLHEHRLVCPSAKFTELAQMNSVLEQCPTV
jgi:hypothetical protein